MPLSLRIVAAVALALVLGLSVGSPMVPFGELGAIVIRLLKLLASPLVFFAVIDAFVHLEIPLAKGARLIAFSTLNAIVATALGLGVAHLLHGGVHWRGKIDAMLHEIGATSGASLPVQAHGWIETLTQMVPKHALEPFMSASILPVMSVALAIGIAMRRVRKQQPDSVALDALAQCARAGLLVCMEILRWLIALVPFAVLLVVAAVVAKTGVHVFGMLGWFLLAVVCGLAAHVLLYYPLLLWLVVGRSPLRFLREGADAIVTALSAGSSLATLPVTLRCLDERMRVSPESARLAACVGTNLNHDGIILYEAAAAVFVSQALGFDLSLAQQLTIAGASVMAGIGIAGVPEAGLITLPLVLGAAGVPDAAVLTLVPLLFTVDWLIGRLRAATNVVSDMLVAVLLDGRSNTG